MRGASIDVRIATERDESELVRTLAVAFDRDPFVEWFVRKDQKRPSAVDRYFRVILRRLIPFASVYTTPSCNGVAVWSPPGQWELSPLEQLRLLPDMLHIIGADRLSDVATRLVGLEKSRPAERHYFLALVGTVPAMQGHGIGSAILRPALERCDREGMTAVLDTYLEHNRRWYERLGFEVIHDIDLGEGAPKGWSMARPAQSSREERTG